MTDVPELCGRLRAFHSKIMNEAAAALEQEVENWKKRNREACDAENKLAEAVRLLDALLGLERGSGAAALLFVENYRRVGQQRSGS